MIQASHQPVAIVILTWNNPDDTLDCLRTVTALDCSALTTIVVDNGSTDDSVARIRAAHPAVDLIETGENLGYAGGNNVGIRHALMRGAEAICILNNDVTIDPDFLAPLLLALQERPDVGIVTPLIAQRADEDRCVWALGSAVNWRTAAVNRQHAGEPVHLWRRQVPFDVEIASGAAMLVKREVFEQVGMMDEEFFLYYEEVDWCLNVRRAGYRILAVPQSIVWHAVSSTLGATSPVIDYYMARNQLRLINRHWHGARRSYQWARAITRNLLAIAAFSLKSHDKQRIPHRDVRLLALRDALQGRWGKMGPDVARICYPNQ